MLLSINQPCYLPWTGLFERIDRADLHIHLDDVPYSKNDFFNRNRILDRAGREVMLTLPVHVESLQTTFVQATVSDAVFWRRKHPTALSQCYRRTDANAALFEGLGELYARPFAGLADLNIAFTDWLMRVLGIRTPTLRASQMSVEGSKDERLIAFCRAVGADAYYSPVGAREYIRSAVFHDAAIALKYQDYAPAAYAQSPTAAFVSHLSVVDVLLRHGAETALRCIREGAREPRSG